MTDRGKTIMCGVLFLDISEYSRKSVSGQISLKERFNAYLSVAIRDVPIDDRIILDTGDGAALSFLGDIGDALQVALSMRESLREGLHMEPPLLVRMGINLGPVRLVRDINGQPNIVGDGINVAQRVMGFADPGQILVSRSYYDAVSRLSPEYANMFHYQGSRTDKHVREHEIYAIGYPGEFTSTLTLSGDAANSKGELAVLSKHLGKSWKAAVAAFWKAPPLKRIVYAGAVLFPVTAVVALLVLALTRPAPPSAVAPNVPASAPQVAAVIPASAVVAVAPAVPMKQPGVEKPAEAKGVVAQKATGKGEHGGTSHASKAPTKKKSPEKKRDEKSVPAKNESVKSQSGKKDSLQATLTVACTPGTTVFIDGQAKGKIEQSSMQIQVAPGSHLVMLIYTGKAQVYSKTVNVAAGQTIKVSPGFCH